jgi:hypothetical protein
MSSLSCRITYTAFFGLEPLEAHARAVCSDVVQWVKIAVQRDISLAVKAGSTRYLDKLWQRGFYDRVVRNDREVARYTPTKTFCTFSIPPEWHATQW